MHSKLATCFAAGVVSILATGCGPENGSSGVDSTFGGPDDPTALHIPKPVPTVPVGEPFPSIKCEGWVGESFDIKSAIAAERPVLFDIWGEWCMGNREAAPGLVQVHEEFKDRVTFVGLTREGQLGVEEFRKENGHTWSSGYEVDLDFANSLGAVNYGATNFGYEILPTFVLVGSDGRIVWYDRKMRLDHVDTPIILDKLREVLRKELGEAAETHKTDENVQAKPVAAESESDTSEESTDESDPDKSNARTTDKSNK